MTKKLLIFVASILMLSSVAFAQETPSAEDAAIRRTVQYYFDGVKNDDVASMKRAFNPKAKWFFPTTTGELAEIRIEQVFTALAKNAKQKSGSLNLITRIISANVTGEIASVKVEFEFPAIEARVTQTEYLSLIKFKGGWQIVGKVFQLQGINTLEQQSVSLKQ